MFYEKKSAKQDLKSLEKIKVFKINLSPLYCFQQSWLQKLKLIIADPHNNNKFMKIVYNIKRDILNYLYKLIPKVVLVFLSNRIQERKA
jgi:hypothetical protein